jgi:ATP-dependent helicase/nuclease subunit B
MPEPERIILDWAEPTAPAAVRWLRDQRPGGLANILVLVPTQQAGRRLRAALGPVTPPRILTPVRFLEPPGEDLASPLEAVLALSTELATSRTTRLTSLFPQGVPARTFPERLALARNFRSLQTQLAEGGLTIAEAAGQLAFSADADRWSDLARLFAAAEATLTRSGRRDRETARIALARRPLLPAGIDEVVVIAVADLPPVVAQALARLAVPVTILVPGPPEPETFDPWGRPLPAAWIDRAPGWSDFDAQVRLVPRPDHLDVNLADVDEIGLLDREMLPALAEELATTGRALHDPTGLALTQHWLPRTIGAFAALIEEPAFDRSVDLVRNGAVRAWLQIPDLEAALLQADAIAAKHFPATLRAARRWTTGPLRAALDQIAHVLTDLRNHPMEGTQNLAEKLADAFAPQLTDDEQSLLTAAREAMTSTLEALQCTVALHPGLSAADRLHAFREAIGGLQLYPARPPQAVEASGWLELPWSETPRLLLAGMNLGKVPAPLGGDQILTEPARAALGLPGADARRARDAYFLARLLAQRGSERGAVTLLVGQLDAEGSPLQPSPLLFAGAGTSLPARVEFLFADPRPPRPDPAWTAGWPLDPPVVEMPRRISATDFERYLDCPFTFYLGRVVKMQTFAPAADELDAAQFGDLLHYALEHWAADDDASRSTDPAIITRALDAHVGAWAETNLGARLSLPLRVQIDSARSRLAAFANWQAEDFRTGWRIRAVETDFKAILGRPWELDGWTISGRVDRLDENELDGRWRVVDYKTFDGADGPQKKHLRAFRTADRTWPPAYARVPESADWWINLQLPLYRQLLLESGRDADKVACGYFNLPKTISETRLQTWDTLDEVLQSSALACARGVLADLACRRFWPPNPRAAHADFAEFFPPDPARIVNPEGAFVRSCA